MSESAIYENPKRQRIHAIDWARGVALIAMAIYHFTWDLDFFGYVPSGLSTTGGFAIFAHMIAGSFLFVSGYSLYMAHGQMLRLPSFMKRLGILVLASAAITAVSWFMMPNALIYFGILHAIAVFSVIGLAFVRVPALLSLILAIFIVVVPHIVSFSALDPRYFAWIGLAAHPPESNDYVPLFPWFGAFLAGIAVSRYSLAWLKRQKQFPQKPGLLSFCGRHSLAFYLIHQPVLYGLVYAVTLIAPPDPGPSYLSACQLSCEATDPAAFCTSYCSCTLNELKAEELLTPLLRNETTDADAIALNRIAMMCSAQ